MKRFDAWRRWAGEGFVLLLLFMASLWLALSLKVGGWLPEADQFVALGLWAAALGVALARSPLPTGAAWLTGLLIGVEYSLQLAGKVLPPAYLVRHDLRNLGEWLQAILLRQQLNAEFPLSWSLGHLNDKLYYLGLSLADWVDAVQSGTTSTDNTMLLLGSGLLAWMVTWNAGFQLFRSRQALAGLVPLGIAVLAEVSFTGMGLNYATFFLGTALLLILWTNAERMQLVWQYVGVQVAPQVRRHVIMTGFPLAGLIFALALVMPHDTTSPTADLFWDRAGAQLRAFYQRLDRAFAGRNPVPKPTVAPDQPLNQSGPPRLGTHDIRGGTDPSDQPVMLVRTSDPAPGEEGQAAPKHYWRDRTYDTYVRYGWTTSETDVATFDANAQWKEIGYPYSVLTQTFTLLQPKDLSFAVNEPVLSNQPYQILTRGAGDLAGFSTGTTEYSVLSLVPAPTIAELRAAEGAYPDWVAQRFLSLPPIPGRVEALARRIVEEAGATTRYDMAKALETYLRSFEYDLNVPLPPARKDVVDYFLFDVQRGYCDYSATALVVMLRSLGVAARYASGYAMGTYDPAQGAWVVTGQNAHAWAEVYFPGYGWIEFEPTPTQSVFTRASERPVAPLPEESPTPDLAAALAQPTLAPNATQTQTTPNAPWPVSRALPVVLAGGGLLLLLVGVTYPRLRKPRAQGPEQAVWRAYERLVQRGRWLGVPPRDDRTPRETIYALSNEVARRNGTAPDAREDIHVIGGLYERARYSDRVVTPEDGTRAEAAWQRFRRALLRLVLARKQ